MPVIANVTFDCADARTLASFWAAAIGWEVAPNADEEVASVGGPRRPAGAPALLFMRVPESKTAKNRNHLDLHTSDVAGELERLVGLGATVVHEQRRWGVHWYTLTDPEGNEFCLVEDADAPV